MDSSTSKSKQSSKPKLDSEPTAPASASSWVPPTPQSLLVPVQNASPPPLLGFEPLPPPLSSLPRDDTSASQSASWQSEQRPRAPSFAKLLNSHTSTDQLGSNHASHRATPSSVVRDDDELEGTPVQGYFVEEPSRQAIELDDETPLTNLFPKNSKGLTDVVLSTATTPEEPPHQRKRPRREASVAAKLALRQPSPLDLSPPYHPSGSQTNRKVSHSLIERRRREKINQCLMTLKEIVPQCREEGERKSAKAKERGRKRGRKNDDGEEEGQRAGLHKLEILEGTILYIRQLEEQLADAEAAKTTAPASRESSSSLSTLDSFTSELKLPEPAPPPPTPVEQPQKYTGPPPLAASKAQGEAWKPANFHDEDTAAGLLLLKFSTSPELRPVFYD